MSDRCRCIPSWDPRNWDGGYDGLCAHCEEREWKARNPEDEPTAEWIANESSYSEIPNTSMKTECHDAGTCD